MTIELNEDELNSINGGLFLESLSRRLIEPKRPNPISFNPLNQNINLDFDSVNRNRG